MDLSPLNTFIIPSASSPLVDNNHIDCNINKEGHSDGLNSLSRVIYADAVRLFSFNCQDWLKSQKGKRRSLSIIIFPIVLRDSLKYLYSAVHVLVYLRMHII